MKKPPPCSESWTASLMAIAISCGSVLSRDAAPVGDAVEPGQVAGQPAYALGEVEGAAFPHPIAEEKEPEPGVAQIDEVRASIGQRDPAAFAKSELQAGARP
jgi:hypothetical protein